MASITYNNASKYRHLGQEEEECPDKLQAETLRDKILKGYLQKQLQSNKSLEEHRQSKKYFLHASVQESITSATRGLLSNEDYKKLQNDLTIKEVLRSSGLCENEMKLLLNDDQGMHQTPAAREEALKVIREKLQIRQQELDSAALEPEQFSGAIPLNRHDFEEEMNTLPCNEKADKLTACLVRLEPHHNDSVPAEHPINRIKEIVEDLFPSNVNENPSVPRKRKGESMSDEEKSKRSLNNDTLKYVYLKEKPKSLWDMKEIPKIIGTQTAQNKDSSAVYTDRNTKEKEMKDKLIITKKEKVIKHEPAKPFVLTINDKELIPLEEIESNRKTLDELKEMDKFKNLKEGDPSQTLYVKNLSHKISPHDLASLFGHFEPHCGPKIQYRIMNGRMKGQAFVTFQDSDVAKSALRTCIGFVLHGNPIVIEFSKH